MRCVAVMPRDAAPTLPAAQVGGSSMQMWLCLCHVCLCLFPYVCLCLCRGCLCQPQRVPLPLQIATQALRAFAGMACFPSARQELAESQQLVAGEWVDGWLGVVSCWMDGLCEWVVVVGFNAGLRPLPCKDPRPTRPLCCCCRRRVMCARARCAIFCPQRVPWVPYPCPPPPLLQTLCGAAAWSAPPRRWTPPCNASSRCARQRPCRWGVWQWVRLCFGVGRVLASGSGAGGAGLCLWVGSG